jgi:cytidylate kinase
MAIITIARQLGSFGEEIAQNLAQELNYALLSKAEVSRRLIQSGYPLEKREGETMSEDKEPSFFQNFGLDRKKLLYYMKKSIYEFALYDNAIILGMGGPVLFEQVPNTLHILLLAPREIRIQRVQAETGGMIQDAEHLVDESDRARARFNKHFFNVDWESAALYDVVINTHTMSAQQILRLLRTEIRERDQQAQAQVTAAILEDRMLAQQVWITLLYEEKIVPLHLDIAVQNRVATLHGHTPRPDEKERCTVATQAIPGIQAVINNMTTESLLTDR